MFYVMTILSGIIGVYMFLICVRILLSWFPGADFGGPLAFLRIICDPYLAWFRRFRISRNSPIDFSPLIALAALSLVQRLLAVWGTLGKISGAAVLLLVIQAVWSIISWVLGFFIIILILRLIAYLGNFNIYSSFWRFVDFIAQPVMYRVTRLFFPARIVNYLFRIVLSIVLLILLGGLLWTAKLFLTLLLQALPF